MNVTRRWFLQTGALAAIATQLPMALAKGHRVLFIDDSAYFVQNFTEADGIIQAKVVNGLWDLKLDTRLLKGYCYSNPGYGYDADCVEPQLMNTFSYRKMVEVEVSSDIGEVTDDLKPRTYMVPKFEEVEETKRVQHGDDGKWHFEKVKVVKPVMNPEPKEYVIDHSQRKYWVPDSWDGPGHYEYGGTLTFTYYEPVMEEHTYDPLNGTGIDYNAVIAAAQDKRKGSWWPW